jgi:hypothetical protein
MKHYFLHVKFEARFDISFTRKPCPTKSDTFLEGWSILFPRAELEPQQQFLLPELKDARSTW